MIHTPAPPALTRLQKQILRVLLLELKHRPNAPGLTAPDIAEATCRNMGAVREALRRLPAALRSLSDAPVRLVEMRTAPLGPIRYRVIPREPGSDGGTRMPAPPLAPLPDYDSLAVA